MWRENLSGTSATREHRASWGVGSWGWGPLSSYDFWSQALSPQGAKKGYLLKDWPP